MSMKKRKMEEGAGGPRIMRGVRMSDAEWKTVCKAAKAAGMAPSEFVRAAALVQAGDRARTA